MVDEPRRARFQRTERLLTASDFESVFQQPQRSSGKALTVLARPSGHASSRLGLAVARKQIRRAVDRNRAKRLIRESFRRHQALLCGLDVVVIGKRALLEKDNRSVFACLETHWQRVSERCRNSAPR